MKRIPLFGEGLTGYSAAVSRQRRLNCFYDIRKDGDKEALILRGTPGTLLFVTLPTSPIRGWRVVNNVLYVVAGAVLYSLTTAGVRTTLGVMTYATTMVSMADNGVQLLIVDGLVTYCYTLVTGSYNQSSLNAAGSFGQVTADANLPAGATSIDFLDGSFIVNKPNTRQFYVSAYYDGTLWTSVSASLPIFATKDNASDLLVAVNVLNGNLILWGNQTIEFWQDVGNSPLPFARINGATQTWGLAAVNSRAYIANTMAFLAQNPQGGVQVMMLQGYAPTRISTSDIEDIFSGFSTVADAQAFAYITDGHPMYQINFPTASRSFLYDALTNMWQEVQTGLALTARHFGNLGIAFNAKSYMADYTSGNIYEVSASSYTDNGASIKRQVATRHVHMDGNAFSIGELFIDMETGVGLQLGQGVNPQMMLRVSRDGGRTFGIEKWVPIGRVGQYLSPRVLWRRLGMGRDFVFELTMTDPVKFTIIAGSVTVSMQEGASGGG